MSSVINHIICTHRLDVQFYGTEQQGLHFQNRIAAYCKSDLFLKLEPGFDRMAGHDNYISIDRLEVDVSGDATSDFDDHFAQVLATEVIAALRDRIARNGLQPGQPERNVQTRVQHDIKVQSNRQHAADTFIHFLNYGRLPWNVQLRPGQSLEQYLVEKIPGIQLPASHAGMMEKLMSKADIRKRMLQTFTPGFVQQVLRQLPAIQRLTVLGHLTVDEKTLVFGQSQRKSNSADPHTPSNTEERHARTPNLQKAEATSKVMGTNDILQTRPFDLQGEAIFIANSGLVLLHPFLPQLFEALQLVNENAMADPGVALQVLHYIGTGQRSTAEHELVLPKVLCGLPVDMFVETVDPLHDDHCHEIERMLQAIIQHWSALRNTSISGLQETFLQRAGKLLWDSEKGWVLLVEVKTFDILLDYIPWGFSRIKFPWMNEMLHVQWDHQQLS